MVMAKSNTRNVLVFIFIGLLCAAIGYYVGLKKDESTFLSLMVFSDSNDLGYALSLRKIVKESPKSKVLQELDRHIGIQASILNSYESGWLAPDPGDLKKNLELYVAEKKKRGEDVGGYKLLIDKLSKQPK